MQILVCVKELLCPPMGSEAPKPKHCLRAQTGTNKMLRHAARIMKLTALLILGACLHVHAVGFGQKISLSETNTPIQTVLKKIEEQTKFKFLYAEHVIKDAKKITVHVKDASIGEALKLCFKDQPFYYEISEKTIIITPKINYGTPPGEKQATSLIDIKGRVVNENGDPVENVNVTVKGTSSVASTNSNGEFGFKGIDENAKLVFTSVNMETFEVNVKGQVFLNVALQTKITAMQEVVINKGYYTEQQKFSTGNVSKVTAKDIQKSPVTNILLALQARVPGMEIIQTTGLPGSGVTVRIRGRNSINNGNDPLYVIDGVPYLGQMLPGLSSIAGNSGSFGENAAYQTGSPLSYLNPGDIESVEVLKDADATAIYGTRGANGVVLITTKKGKVGPTRVDVNVQQGWGRVTRFVPWMNTRKYLDMRYEAYRNDGADLSTLTPDGSNYDLTLWDTTRYTDWNKKLIGGTARYSNIQLSLYGGSNNVQYRLGYNFNKQTTTFPGSFGDPKGSLNFSVNTNSANNKLKVQLSGNYQIDKNSLPSYDLSQYTDLAPDAPSLYNADGSLNWAPDPATGYPTWSNPLATLNRVYKRRVNNLVTNAVFSYELIKGLDIKVNAGYTNMQSDEINTTPASVYAPVLVPYITRESQFATTQNDSWIVEPQLSYTSHVGGGQLSAVIGTTIQENDSKGQSLTASGFNNDLVMEDIKAAAFVTFDNSIDAMYKYNAVFGRFNYNLREKYLVNLTARRDGTSRFGPDKQYANFGAIGLGWIFSKENFISKKMPFLSYGKIRGSYGTTGSDQVGDYRYLNLYNYTSFNIPYQNSLSIGLNGLFNPDLAWEETKKLEAAIELGFWQDRILLSTSYYRNRCSNQLTSYGLPQTTGANSILANLDATVQNSGWEFSINTINFQSRDFRWNSSINLSIPENKLVSVSPEAITVDKRLVGHSLFTRFLYSFAGVDPATGVYEFNDGKGGLTFRPDTALDPTTKRPYTQKTLNTGVKYYGGFQNSFSYKGWQLDILFQFEKRLGQTNERGTYPGGFDSDIGSHLQNQPISVSDRWQKPGDNSLVQKYNQNFGDVYHAISYLNNSDGVWADASYIRLKNVSISWQLPVKLRRTLRLQDARLYTHAQNLFTIFTYKGSDPETRSLTTLPPLRMVAIGCQLTF